MGKAIDALSEAQRASFRAGVARCGLSPDKLSRDDTLVTGPGPTILSGNPETSAVPPVLIPIDSIATLKHYAGIPDDWYTSGRVSDRAIDYPPELPVSRRELVHEAKNACDLREQLTFEERRYVQLAADSFVEGNSEKVRNYEDLINAVYFPTQLAAFTFDSIVVTPEKPLVLEGEWPIDIHVGSVLVEEGGQIIVRVQATINAQLFEAQ